MAKYLNINRIVIDESVRRFCANYPELGNSVLADFQDNIHHQTDYPWSLHREIIRNNSHVWQYVAIFRPTYDDDDSYIVYLDCCKYEVCHDVETGAECLVCLD